MINRERIPAAGVLSEQFIPDHVFVYVAKGAIECYDGNKNYFFKAGDYCIARKNRLARYTIISGKERFEPVMFCFDEAFLKSVQKKYKAEPAHFKSTDTFLKVKRTKLIPDFIRSLKPYSDNEGRIAEVFEDLKYEELLLILLQNEPSLSGLFFDFGIPEKIDIEEFMNRNFSFNVSVERFAFLTGRSLSAFKRDFYAIFRETPGRWLVQKRLEEAYFLIGQKKKKASEIYLDLGFEALSHFSYAFKKRFGVTTRELGEKE